MLKYRDAEDNARGARINAFYNNEKYKHTYSLREQARAQTVVDLLDLAYKGTIYVNYRKQFISIKLARGAMKRDKYYVQQFALFVKESGFEQVETPQATIFHVQRIK
jgi:hypothetical protein